MDEEKLHEMDKSVLTHDLRLKHIEEKLPLYATRERVDMVEEKLATKAPLDQFLLVKGLAFGLVGLILIAVITALLNQLGLPK